MFKKKWNQILLWNPSKNLFFDMNVDPSLILWQTLASFLLENSLTGALKVSSDRSTAQELIGYELLVHALVVWSVIGASTLQAPFVALMNQPDTMKVCCH